MRQLLTGASGPSYKRVRLMQDMTAAAADTKVPVDTGTLKGSQVKTPVVVTGDRVVAGVEYRSPYALFVHEGTKAHVIRPRNKKILAWVPRGSGAKTRFAMKVNHPGTKAKKWLLTSMWAVGKKMGFTVTKGE